MAAARTSCRGAAAKSFQGKFITALRRHRRRRRRRCPSLGLAAGILINVRRSPATTHTKQIPFDELVVVCARAKRNQPQNCGIWGVGVGLGGVEKLTISNVFMSWLLPVSRIELCVGVGVVCRLGVGSASARGWLPVSCFCGLLLWGLVWPAGLTYCLCVTNLLMLCNLQVFESASVDILWQECASVCVCVLVVWKVRKHWSKNKHFNANEVVTAMQTARHSSVKYTPRFDARQNSEIESYSRPDRRSSVSWAKYIKSNIST